jgi:Tfp pilus assembly major pilin PilA
MRLQTKLLAGAALSVLMATGAGASAQAKAARHHKAAPAPAVATAAEVSELRAEVQALKAELTAQQQANQATQAQAQQAQADAKAATDQARTLQAQADNAIKTIPADIKTAMAAAKPKPGWEANTQVSGRMYYNLSNIEQKRDGVKAAPSGTGFEIKRLYIGVDHKFNDTYSANVTTDVAYVAADGLTQVYLKKAYLQAKYSDAVTFRLGSADLPWVPYAEDIYGYRYLENTISERDKMATSADWGVHMLGKVGIFNYQVSVVDGGGYKNPVRTKTMDIEGRVSTAWNGLNFAIGGYTGKLGKDVQGGVAAHHTANRFDALAAYVQPKFRIGVEYFATEDWNNVTTVASDKADGYSLFGSYNFTPEISVFGRYDWAKPSKTLVSNQKDNYFNLGLNYQPVKVVDLSLVYKRDVVDNGLVATSNGTIGGVHRGTYDEIGLFGQVRY